jgi:hypothetical protein
VCSSMRDCLYDACVCVWMCVCVFQCVFKRIQTDRRTSKRLDVTVEDGMNLFAEK